MVSPYGITWNNLCKTLSLLCGGSVFSLQIGNCTMPFLPAESLHSLIARRLVFSARLCIRKGIFHIAFDKHSLLLFSSLRSVLSPIYRPRFFRLMLIFSLFAVFFFVFHLFPLHFPSFCYSPSYIWPFIYNLSAFLIFVLAHFLDTKNSPRGLFFVFFTSPASIPSSDCCGR